MEEKRLKAYQDYWHEDIQIGDLITYYHCGNGIREGLVKGKDDHHLTIHRTSMIPLMISYANVVQITKRREHLTDWWNWL